MSDARRCGLRADRRSRILRSVIRRKVSHLCAPRRLSFMTIGSAFNAESKQWDIHARTTEPQMTHTVDCVSRGMLSVSMISLKKSGTCTFSSYGGMISASRDVHMTAETNVPCHRRGDQHPRRRVPLSPNHSSAICAPQACAQWPNPVVAVRHLIL